MTIPGSANPLLLKAPAGGGGGEYTIERSVRFNSSDSAHLSKNFASAGNRKTWTWAGWVKRSGLSSSFDEIFGNASGSGNSASTIFFYTDDCLYFQALSISNTYALVTTQVFRDLSAWYHIVVVADTTNAVSTDRLRIYVNGSRVSSFSTANYPPINYDTFINQDGVAHYLGRMFTNTYFNGYLADIHFCDGYAYDPSYFTEFDDNGILQPIAFTGSYGTNGFHLTFSDNSTAAALGTDTSGNNNDWTVNNISVTAGAGNDSLVDSPTNGTQTDTGVGGEVVGNYCTLNPLKKGANLTLANGNLDQSGSGQLQHSTSTFAVSSGKWYFEVTHTTGEGNSVVGLVGQTSLSQNLEATNWLGQAASHWGYYAFGEKYNSSSGTSFGDSWSATGSVVSVAFDADTGKIWFAYNGTWQASGDPAAGTSPAFTASSYGVLCPAGRTYLSGALTFNFGQRPFAYTAPSGFKALCTTNLPSTTITTSGSYTGNGVADGPFVYLNGVPTAMTVGGNSVTFGTDADKLSNGFKIRTTSTTYNQNANTYNYTITSTGAPFKTARAQPNP